MKKGEAVYEFALYITNNNYWDIQVFIMDENKERLTSITAYFTQWILSLFFTSFLKTSIS